MAGTRKARVPMAEQLRLINECRQSGMTDADWCRENDIAVSTFYNWVSRCRKAAADQIPAVYISDKLTILHGQSDHLSRRFRSLISERDSRRSKSFL